ncbi:terminase [Anabaena phage A-4L]|uniref:Terminase n=1 Tax=Anabaena phage A-4L TaxID=1357732 RepID=A0A059PYE3_9CAUD|nr:terminase [Anabaena phage A-4L]AGR48563.1 terminase [Anabaena phage A-4L]
MAQMPRGHLKSTIGSVLYILWRIYRNPDIRILYGSAELRLVKAFMRELKQYLEDENLATTVWNARPHIPGRLVPILDGQRSRAKKRGDEFDDTEATDKKVLWNAQAIQVVREWKGKEATVFATSLGSKATGDHYDLLILDDIVDKFNSDTPAKRETLFDWCQDMESVIDPVRRVLCGKAGTIEVWDEIGDEVLILGTRYFRGDYYEYIEQNAKDLEYKVFKRNIYRNGKNADGNYLWAEKFTPEYVARLRKRLTSKQWASQYLNTIFNNEDVKLNRDSVKWLTSRELHANSDGTVLAKIPDSTKPIELRPYIIIDPAISQSATADATSILVGAVDHLYNVYVLDVKYGRFNPNKTVELVEELVRKWNTFCIYIETNNVGAALSFTLRNHFKTRMPIVIREHRVGQGNVYGIKGDKATRIENRIQPLLENGQLWMVDFIAANQLIMDEFDLFPSKGGHDDFLDTIDQLCAIAKPRPQAKPRATQSTRHVNTKYGGTR